MSTEYCTTTLQETIYTSAEVQKLDSVNRRINRYPSDKYYKHYKYLDF